MYGLKNRLEKDDLNFTYFKKNSKRCVNSHKPDKAHY